MVLAVFAMRRSNGARIGLVVSAALVAAILSRWLASCRSVLPLIACIVVIVCLFAGGARRVVRRPAAAPPAAAGQAPAGRLTVTSQRGLAQPAQAVLDHERLLAERPAHQVPAGVLVVVEALARDRHHAGPLGQRLAELQPVVPAEVADVGHREVGALGHPRREADVGEAAAEQVAVVLQARASWPGSPARGRGRGRRRAGPGSRR